MCACPMPWTSAGAMPHWGNDIWKYFQERNNEALANCIDDRPIGVNRRCELCPDAKRLHGKLPGYIDPRFWLSADLRSKGERLFSRRAARSQSHRHEFAS